MDWETKLIAATYHLLMIALMVMTVELGNGLGDKIHSCDIPFIDGSFNCDDSGAGKRIGRQNS